MRRGCFRRAQEDETVRDYDALSVDEWCRLDRSIRSPGDIDRPELEHTQDRVEDRPVPVAVRVALGGFRLEERDQIVFDGDGWKAEGWLTNACYRASFASASAN